MTHPVPVWQQAGIGGSLSSPPLCYPPTMSRAGHARLTGTIRALRAKIAAQDRELAMLRRVMRAARTYYTTGRDQTLRRVIEECFLEDPPRKTPKAPAPEPQPVAEGRSISPVEDYELL